MGTKSKAIVYFIVSALIIVGFSGLIWLYLNKPSADIPTPPVPPAPTNVVQVKPPVPVEPRISGDANDDGLVDALDLNAIIVFWKTVTRDYNMVDAKSDTPFMVTALDLSMTITYWRCLEQKGIAKCPYIVERIVDAPTPGTSATAVPSATNTPPDEVGLPPVPQV